MNKAEGRVRALRGKLPESTGDKLPAGEMDSNLPGEIWIGLYWGSFELYWGGGSIECLIYRQGTIFRSRLPGMLVKTACIYAAGEC